MITKIKKFNLKLICLGKEVKNQMFKTYYRYSCSIGGKQKFWHYPTDYLLTKDQVKLINANEYGGHIQQELDNIKAKLFTRINGLTAINNSYPSPDQLKEYFEQEQTYYPMDYYVNDYLKHLKVQPSSKKIIANHIANFVKYYNSNLTKQTLEQIISNRTINNFGDWLVMNRRFKNKKMGLVQKHNIQNSVVTFLNYLAKQYKLTILEDVIGDRPVNEQFKLSTNDFERLIGFNDNDKHQVIQDYIYINSFIGLRVSEFLGITNNNITINSDHIQIKFSEYKKNKPRTVAIVDLRAIELIKYYMNDNPSLTFIMSRHTFNNNLKSLAKEVFKDETISLHSGELNKPIGYLKHKKISSHAIRRYAVQRNISKYGVDVAKTFSGHRGYQTINLYAKDALEVEVVLAKLLGK